MVNILFSCFYFYLNYNNVFISHPDIFFKYFVTNEIYVKLVMPFLYQFWAWFSTNISEGSDTDHGQPREDLSASEEDSNISCVGESKLYWFIIQSLAS